MISVIGGLVLAAAASTPPPVAEMRGLWVVRTGLVSAQAVDEVVAEAKRGGFNAVFVQVRGRGDAFYASRLVPRSELLRGQPSSFDPLAYLLRRARAEGLQVHAWVNVLLTAGFGVPLPADHVVVRHPEWMMVPHGSAVAADRTPRGALAALVERGRDADAEGFYLSPSAPGAAAHLEAVVQELVRSYALDGIHLDFIRYPSAEYDYSRAALEGFADGRRGELLARAEADPEGFAEYRRRTLDAMVGRLSRAARAARPGLVVSAAVVPDQAQALYHRYQDWPSWMAAGWLDAVCPMAYTPDTRLFRAQLEQARARVGGGARLWAGVGAYRLPVDGIVEKIRAAREAGASGVLLFSHESLGGLDLDRLRAEVFAAAAGDGGARAEGRAQ